MPNNVHRIMLPHRGFGHSLGNMIQVLSGEASAMLDGNWIEVEECTQGVFVVVNDNFTDTYDARARGFTEWDNEMQDLDKGRSDEASCFGMSNHLVWNDVDLTPDEFRAPSVERLMEALHHVAICAWCPDDI